MLLLLSLFKPPLHWAILLVDAAVDAVASGAVAEFVVALQSGEKKAVTADVCPNRSVFAD